MGEWSKKVGETGEAVAGEFLRLIGWGAAQQGVELPCSRPEAHKNSEAGRRTHGIDYLLPCKSPLSDAAGQNLVVSVKYSDEGYPANPKTLFKAHFTDLAHTLECFKNSEVRRNAAQAVKGVTRGQDIARIFHKGVEQKGGRGVRKLENTELYDDTLYRPEPPRL